MTIGGLGARSLTEVDVATLADRVLDLAGHLAGAGADADVHVAARSTGLTWFAGSVIHENAARWELQVRLRIAVDGRWAGVTSDSAAAATSTRFVQSAVDAARGRRADPGYPGMALPTRTDATGNWDEATAVATPHERVKVVRDFVAGLRGLDAAGFVETSGERAIYVNSAGQHLRGRRTWATVDGLARTSTSDGVARGSAVRLGDLSGVEAGTVAAAAARSATEPSDLDAGEYEMVLAPGCVASILRNLARCGFNGCRVLAGESFVELGARQFDPAIRLWDDATDSLSTSLPYDAEGTPRGRIDLVVDGVSRGVLHDRRTAAAASVQSTGHATPGSERSGPYPTDLRLAVGDGGHTDDLVRRLRRGLLLTDFGQTRVVEPRAVVVTGFTRHAAWLVEHGEVIRPVRDLRFTQSYVDALGPGAVIAVGSVSGALLDQRSSGLYVAPSIALAGWRVHGSAG